MNWSTEVCAPALPGRAALLPRLPALPLHDRVLGRGDRGEPARRVRAGSSSSSPARWSSPGRLEPGPRVVPEEFAAAHGRRPRRTAGDGRAACTTPCARATCALAAGEKEAAGAPRPGRGPGDARRPRPGPARRAVGERVRRAARRPTCARPSASWWPSPLEPAAERHGGRKDYGAADADPRAARRGRRADRGQYPGRPPLVAEPGETFVAVGQWSGGERGTAVNREQHTSSSDYLPRRPRIMAGGKGGGLGGYRGNKAGLAPQGRDEGAPADRRSKGLEGKGPTPKATERHQAPPAARAGCRRRPRGRSRAAAAPAAAAALRCRTRRTGRSAS